METSQLSSMPTTISPATSFGPIPGDADAARKREDGARQSGVPGAKRRVRKAGAIWATDEQSQLTSMTMKAGLPDGTIRKRLENLTNSGRTLQDTKEHLVGRQAIARFARRRMKPQVGLMSLLSNLPMTTWAGGCRRRS